MFSAVQIEKSVWFLAKDSQKTIIVYYGVAGHGKGLVDVASGFGVKDPIRKAIILEDWYFNSSMDMVRFLSERNGNDNKKIYVYFPVEDIQQLRSNNDIKKRKIKGSRMLHCLVFKPAYFMF